MGDGKRFRGSFNYQVGGWQTIQGSHQVGGWYLVNDSGVLSTINYQVREWYLNSLGVSLNWRMFMKGFISWGMVNNLGVPSSSGMVNRNKTNIQE